MLKIKPSRRRLLLAALVIIPALFPWRLTSAAPPFPIVALPNLDFTDGLESWRKAANGSDTLIHPFYSVGTDTRITYEGRPVGYVKAKANIAQDPPGDGGVLRYDIPAEKYQKKRLRWSGYVQGVGLKQKAFLFLSAQGTRFPFVQSTPVTSVTSGWVKRECVVDVPSDAVAICLGLRLEGGGIAYGSSFKLEVVDKTVPSTNTVVDLAGVSEEFSPPQNLTFTKGLDGWWNDNPDHNAEADYTLGLSKGSGRSGGSAAYLKNKVVKPRSYGTIAQNASAADYRGKRIRLSTYLKSKSAKEGALWIVVVDKDPNKSIGLNGTTTGKVIRGNQDWTRFEHIINIPATTQALSFGISSEGKGTVWADGFKIEVLGPAEKVQ